MDMPFDSDLDLLAIEEFSVEDLPENAAARIYVSTVSSAATTSSVSSIGCLSSL